MKSEMRLIATAALMVLLLVLLFAHSSLGNLTPEEFLADYTKRLEAAGFPL